MESGTGTICFCCSLCCNMLAAAKADFEPDRWGFFFEKRIRINGLCAIFERDPQAREMLISRYRVPQPRNALAQAVRDHATAAMDVSDGLAGDLTKLCAASGVSATIDVASVPLSYGLLDPRITSSVLMQAMALAILVGAMGALLPARRAIRISPAEAMRRI